MISDLNWEVARKRPEELRQRAERARQARKAASPRRPEPRGGTCES